MLLTLEKCEANPLFPSIRAIQRIRIELERGKASKVLVTPSRAKLPNLTMAAHLVPRSHSHIMSATVSSDPPGASLRFRKIDNRF
jgi:hypothetical protein